MYWLLVCFSFCLFGCRFVLFCSDFWVVFLVLVCFLLLLGWLWFLFVFTKSLYCALKFCLVFPYLFQQLFNSLLYLSSQYQFSCNKSLSLIIAYMGWGTVPNAERALNGYSWQDMRCLLCDGAQPIPDHLWFSLSPTNSLLYLCLRKISNQLFNIFNLHF